MLRTCVHGLVVAVVCWVFATELPAADGPRPKPAAAMARRRFDKIDQDADGRLTFDEFNGNRRKRETVERMKRVFALLDTNGDGRLTPAEFANPSREARSLLANRDAKSQKSEPPRRKDNNRAGQSRPQQVASAQAAQPGAFRTWTDRTGEHKVEAELARIEDDNVVLRKSDGTTVAVPIVQLSPADHAFAASLRKAMNPANGDGPNAGEAAAFSRLKSGRPVTGKKAPGVEILDETMDQFMDLIGCQAGTVAVAYGGKLLYSRGYGWLDEAKQRPVVPETTMRIASLSKPFTAAVVKSLIRARRLDPDDLVFPNLDIEPPGGSVVDPRLSQITVLHLLEHRGGFDRGQAFDPMFAIDRIERELDLTSQPTPVDVIRFMLGQPLQFDPGERSCYSNYGYCVLGRVIEKASGKSYIDCLQQTIARPLGIHDLVLSRNRPADRPPSEVNYRTDGSPFTVEVMDAHGGLSTSALSLCRFMQDYWISGEPRRRGDQQNWVFFGSIPGTTAMMQQRPDGILCAVLLNNRRDDRFSADNDRLREVVNQAVDRLKAGSR